MVDLLESLVDKSLVQTEQGPSDLRYRMLETIAQYAADHFAEAAADGTERVKEAHALYYLRFVRSSPFFTGSSQIEWMRKIEVDYDNVRTALTFLAANPGHGFEALRMVGALRIFWSAGLGGNRGKARDLAMAALAHPEARSATKERSESLLSLGSVEEIMGDVDAARSSFEAGLAIAREIGDSALVAEHLCRLAFVFYRRGEYRRVKDTAEQALEMADAIGDPNLQALAHDRMAGAESVDHEAARLHYAEALRLYERAGNNSGINRIYNNLGDLEMIAGNVVAARSALEAALESAVSPVVRAVELANLGMVSVLEGNPESAGLKLPRRTKTTCAPRGFRARSGSSPRPGDVLGCVRGPGAVRRSSRSRRRHGRRPGSIVGAGRSTPPRKSHRHPSSTNGTIRF